MDVQKCIILSRVSTDSQDLTQQTQSVKDEAIRQGFLPENIIIIEDKESAVKLSEEERNGLNTLKSYINKDSSITCVFTYEISRISRQAKIVFSIRDFLIEHHVQLIVMNPYFRMLKEDGTLSETSNIFFGIFASMAENEGFIRKARFKRGKERLRQLGLWTGGKILFGYDVNHATKEYIYHDKDSQTVIEVFNRYVKEGKTLNEIAIELYNEGRFVGLTLLSAKMKVCRIINTKEYTGCGCYPRLVHQAMFDKARIKAQESKNTARKPKTPHYVLFNGVLRQEDTKHLMTYADSRGCYVANNRYKYKRVTIKQHIIDPFLWSIVVKLHREFNENNQSNLIDKLVVERDRLYQRIENHNNLISRQVEKINKIEERWFDDKITTEKRDTLREQCDKEILRLEKEKKQFGLEAFEKKSQIEKLRNRKIIKYDNLTYDEKISIIKDVIKVIYVSRTKHYVLSLKVHNNYNDRIDEYSLNTYVKH